MKPTIRLVISADCHVMEPLDLWTTSLPEQWRARGPRLELKDGRVHLLVEDRVVRKFGKVAGAKEREQASSQGTDTVWMGETDPTRRLADLDRDGVFGEVIYPNIGFFCAYQIENAALQIATCRVYNDWIADVFIGTSERFAPVAMLPVLDVEVAVAELERITRRGFKSALLPAHADFKPYNDPIYERLWAAAADLGMPLAFHAGTGRGQTPARGPGAAVVNYVITVGGPMETIAYLCGSGVLARHPRLRVVMVECGAGWLAWVLNAMDDAYREHHMFVAPKLDLLPSEYFRRQGHVTFQNDPVGLANASFTGDRCLMFGSDYPHPEGTWPHSRKALADQLEGVAQETTDRVTYGNAAELYRLQLPTLE